MGCASSKESAPPKSKRARLYGSDTNLPTQRYLSDPAPRHIKFASGTNFKKHSAGKADKDKSSVEMYPHRDGSKNEARPKETKAAGPKTSGEVYSRRDRSKHQTQPQETFEAYARRGIIRQSALFPESVQSARNEPLSQKARIGRYHKYMNE